MPRSNACFGSRYRESRQQTLKSKIKAETQGEAGQNRRAEEVEDQEQCPHKYRARRLAEARPKGGPQR